MGTALCGQRSDISQHRGIISVLGKSTFGRGPLTYSVALERIACVRGWRLANEREVRVAHAGILVG